MFFHPLYLKGKKNVHVANNTFGNEHHYHHHYHHAWRDVTLDRAR
ncbi:MAG: hypothetical protein QNJ41_06010 [Xenococcaceae cyanobacterium MO_188.B32]|nr:hypothetical protein [Xenococcaceae cyanobacterium MO_188.B32]